MFLLTPKGVNRVKVGPVGSIMIVASILLLPLRLLRVLAKPEHDLLWRGSLVTFFLGIAGLALGLFISWRNPVYESSTYGGMEELTVGVKYGAVFTALLFLINALVLTSSTKIFGDVTISPIDKIFISYHAAINEELFFRFGLQQFFMRLLPNNPIMWGLAIIGSSFVFSLYHIEVYGTMGIQPFIYLFILGCMAGSSMLFSGYLISAFMTHGFNNAIALYYN